MDENAVRLLLQEVAEDPLPPVRIDLAQAARAGRRALRWRRRYLPAVAPIAAAAAVAIIVSLLTVTGAGFQRGTRTGHGQPPAYGTGQVQLAPALRQVRPAARRGIGPVLHEPDDLESGDPGVWRP